MSMASAISSPNARPRRSGRIFKTLVFLSVFAGLALAGADASGSLGRSIALAGHTSDRMTYQVAVGGDALAVPANMIRFERARRDGAATRLDLYAHYPDMAGYEDARRDAFNHAGDSREIVFLSFEEAVMTRDMSGRYEPIYRSLIEETGRKGPGGLSIHRFRPGNGFDGEVLVVGERQGAEPFLARCLVGEAAAISLAPCERDIRLGDSLSVTYRFPAGLAAEWETLDRTVSDFAAALLSRKG